MTHTFRMPFSATPLGFAIGIVFLLASPAAAQIISSAADNDMTPSFADDGWTGAYTSISPLFGNPGTYHYRTPPDGNNYAGADTVGNGVLSKTITGLTPGTQYAVELYWSSGFMNGQSFRPEAFFEVTFCGTTQETQHTQVFSNDIVWVTTDGWVQASIAFAANAESCVLSFRSLGVLATPPHPSGTGGNPGDWLFLDSVQVSVATNSDFGITASGPSAFPASGSTETVSVTVTNVGPAEGTTPIVTYALPDGVSVRSDAAGSLATSGTNAADWSCAGSWIVSCTRSGPMEVGSTSSFSFDIDLATPTANEMAYGTAPRVSVLNVSPTFQTGNVDPNSANSVAVFTTTLTPTVCGDGIATAGLNRCDDGNEVGGDGCSATCEWEAGYRCPPTGDCIEIDECAEGSDRCDPDLECVNTPGSYTCGCDANTASCSQAHACELHTDNCPLDATCYDTADSFMCVCGPGYLYDGFRCVVLDDDECALGTDNCDPNALCTNTIGSFTCACDELYFTGDGVTCTDIDECTVGAGNPCVLNQECINVVGGYGCHVCRPGYVGGDYVGCRDADECALGTDDCDEHASCTNTDGAFTCACNSGYSGDGTSCKPRGAHAVINPKTIKLIARALACNAQPGAPGSSTPLLALGLLSLLLVRRRRSVRPR